MVDQTTDSKKEEASGWTEKKEAMQRLARALENTSPPLMNKNTGNSSLPEQLNGCVLWRKLKKIFIGIFKIH